MRLATSPLHEFEYARAQRRDCPVVGCRICRRLEHRAILRLVLSAAAYTVVALTAIAVVWALIVLLWGALTPIPTVSNVQLPTR